MKHSLREREKETSNRTMTANTIQLSTNDDDDINDPTAPYYETEVFSSIWQALRWKQIRTRVPVCLKKTVRSRYMFANLVYLGYAIGILIIDFNPYVNGTANTSSTDDSTTASPVTSADTSVLDQPVVGISLVNNLYFGK